MIEERLPGDRDLLTAPVNLCGQRLPPQIRADLQPGDAIAVRPGPRDNAVADHRLDADLREWPARRVVPDQNADGEGCGRLGGTHGNCRPVHREHLLAHADAAPREFAAGTETIVKAPLSR
jgi:hypothetical protein